MGVITRGILGGFRKKTGSVVGAYWRKLDIIRALPRASGKAASPLQMAHRQKFALVAAFLSEASDLIEVGFYSSDTGTAMNKAVAYHLREAVTGAAPDWKIDMSKFKYSVGRLKLPVNVHAAAQCDQRIRFEWDGANNDDKYTKPDHLVTFVVFNASKQRFVSKVGATTRSAGSYELQLPENFEGDTVHLYISFSSLATKQHSNSLYVGEVVMTC